MAAQKPFSNPDPDLWNALVGPLQPEMASGRRQGIALRISCKEWRIPEVSYLHRNPRIRCLHPTSAPRTAAGLRSLHAPWPLSPFLPGHCNTTPSRETLEVS